METEIIVTVAVGAGKPTGYEVIMRNDAGTGELRKKILKAVTEVMENAKEVESYHKINGRS